ncbi:MAG: helix-turn-helix domain-containing protein [Chloroflexota bacterium]
MTATMALSVPEAAAYLGRSERTVWRQIRAGDLRIQREGRRVYVVLDADTAPATAPTHARVSEAAAAYGASPTFIPDGEWQVGPWPYTPELVERHRRARLARRRAAIHAMGTLVGTAKPDPDGLTAVDYIRTYRDHPRALDGEDSEDRLTEERGRARRAGR